ncbi:MAG: WD40/YVTN/BNR-like repeat-containing protein, partial [Ignavibacteria bacterium]
MLSHVAPLSVLFQIPLFCEPLTGYAVVAITLETRIEGNGGLLKTTNGGLSWDRIAFADTSFWAVDVRERNGKDEVFIGGFRINNTATVIKGDGLVYRSPDGGATWSQVTDIPWGKNELDDTIRNVWVIRCDEVTKRV